MSSEKRSRPSLPLTVLGNMTGQGGGGVGEPEGVPVLVAGDALDVGLAERSQGGAVDHIQFWW
jgi:hypothetical protein